MIKSKESFWVNPALGGGAALALCWLKIAKNGEFP
jgi:hypothetical protein